MNLRASKVSWLRDGDGEWVRFLVQPFDLKQLDEFNGKELSVEVKECKPRRSLDANSYCWVLIDHIAEKAGLSKSEVYREAIRDIGGNSDTVCVKTSKADKLCSNWGHNGLGWMSEKADSKLDGCTNVTLYYGSSVYDTHQMSLLIDHLVQDAKALGIETKTPTELAGLCEQWK